MALDQYRTDYVRVVLGSKIVYGTTDASWLVATITTNHYFRLDYSGAPYYKVATVLAATRLQLAQRYLNASEQSYPYMITRSFTSCRGYANIYQGNRGFPDILREQIVDKIDNDVGVLYDGTASRDSIKHVTGVNYLTWVVPASGVLHCKRNGAVIAYVGTLTGSWVNV